MRSKTAQRTPGLLAGLLVLLVVALMTVLAAEQVISKETLTIGADPVGLSTATIRTSSGAIAKVCRGRLETAQVRYWTAATPSASSGILLEIGDTVVIRDTANLESIRFVRTGATSGTLPLECER